MRIGNERSNENSHSHVNSWPLSTSKVVKQRALNSVYLYIIPTSSVQRWRIQTSKEMKPINSYSFTFTNIKAHQITQLPGCLMSKENRLNESEISNTIDRRKTWLSAFSNVWMYSSAIDTTKTPMWKQMTFHACGLKTWKFKMKVQ